MSESAKARLEAEVDRLLMTLAAYDAGGAGLESRVIPDELIAEAARIAGEASRGLSPGAKAAALAAGQKAAGMFVDRLSTATVLELVLLEALCALSDPPDPAVVLRRLLDDYESGEPDGV